MSESIVENANQFVDYMIKQAQRNDREIHEWSSKWPMMDLPFWRRYVANRLDVTFGAPCPLDDDWICNWPAEAADRQGLYKPVRLNAVPVPPASRILKEDEQPRVHSTDVNWIGFSVIWGFVVIISICIVVFGGDSCGR